jgi:predicted nucleic acid-binding protein
MKNRMPFKVCFDTAPVVYILDENEAFMRKAGEILRFLRENDAVLYASCMLRAEFHAKPLNTLSERKMYDEFIIRVGIKEIYLDKQIIIEANKLMHAYPSLKLVDALHLGTALVSDCTHFFTNDDRLPRLFGLEMIYVEPKKPLN